MKRPASAMSRKKVAIVVRKRPAAVKKLASGLCKRPAACLKTPKPQCKPIAEMTRRDFCFFKIPAGKNCWHSLRGCKSSRKGYLFEHEGFNEFAKADRKIPASAQKTRVPDQKWLSKFFWDTAKHPLLFDKANLPERATGTAYRIEYDGGMLFVCYVRADAVSVFRQPRDGYVPLDEEEKMGEVEYDRLIYTEEVMTFDNPVKALIGVDDECQEHGNSILVHTSATKGKCLTATVKLDESKQLLQAVCTDLSGSEVFSMEVAIDGKISALAKMVADHLHALCVKCVDKDGTEVAHDKLLEEFSQLTLQDATQSYVYVGSEMYSFDCVEAVTNYYSNMGNSSVPYPVALTASKVIFMMDKVEVPREQIAPLIVNGNWGDAYSAFYSQTKFTKTPLANVKELCPRDF